MAGQPSSRFGNPAPLLGQLRWFIRLRWLAGVMVLLAAVADWARLAWYSSPEIGVSLGASILAYNGVLWAILRRIRKPGQSGRMLLGLAWAQFLLDVISLTLLTLWTGGPKSPLLALFVLHMVFAGLLLPSVMAYGAAAAAMLILVVSLRLAQLWPETREAKLLMIGWCAAVFGTVLVSTHIAQALRRQRRRLLKQNRRIVVMARQLRRQQHAIMQSEKMAALGQMAAGVAHEIANPLAGMDSLLQLMVRKPDKIRPESLATLRELVDRMGRIIRELTTFARPADAQWLAFSPNDLVRESLHMLAFDARLKRAAVQEELSADLGVIPMLPQAMQQVLVNLIRNALDAMETTPSPVLRVRTAREDDWCVIEVADNGDGIDPRNLRKLFEPFFTTKPVGKGTGLGLSISYALIQKHSGLISVRSKPGEGTAFVVKIPLTQPTAQAPVTTPQD